MARPPFKVIDFGVAKAIHQPLTERTCGRSNASRGEIRVVRLEFR
jgi:hypothetical protein